MLTLDLRQRLDNEPTHALLEYLAERLSLTEGQVRIEVILANGQHSKTYLHGGPLGTRELDARGG